MTREEQERNLALRDYVRENGPEFGKPSLDKPWLSIYKDSDILDPVPEMTAYRYLYENNKNNLNAVALNYFGYKVTYRELFEKIDEMVKSLTAFGVKKGDIVGICCTNTPEIVYLFYAISKIGAVADIIDPRINEAVMSKYLNDIKCKLFFCLEPSLPKYYGIIDNTSVEKVINLPILEALPIPHKAFTVAKMAMEAKKENKPLPPVVKMPDSDKYMSFREFKKAGKDGYVHEEEYAKNRPVAIIHTGGTTGIPKGAVLSNDNLNSLVHQLRHTELEFNRGQKWLSLMPPCVAYGLANGMHLSLSCGMQSILIPTYEPEKIDQMILEHKPNRLACSPAHWEYFARSERLKGKDLSYIIHPIEGGDAINPELERQINNILRSQGSKDELRKGYGLSETCAALCVASPLVDNDLLIGSVGFPLVHTTLSIFEPIPVDKGTVDPSEIVELGYNQIGEICAQSDNVMLGYYNRPEENEKTLRLHSDGKVWLHTGDLGLITPDGRVFIKGRTKRIVIRFDGTKVYPADIESVIAKHPAVALVAVVGVRDSAHEQGELPKAYIVLKDEYKNNKEVIEQIAMLCNENLIDYMVPFAYQEIPDMPYTALGKPDFMTLKKIQTETNLEPDLTRIRKQ